MFEEKNCCANYKQDYEMECQSNGTVNGGAKSMVIKTLVYEKMCLNVMLVVLANGAKLPPHVILNHKTMTKEQIPRGTVTCQLKD